MSRDAERWPGLKRVFRLRFARARTQRDVDAELRFHIDERVEELVAAGMSRAAAEAQVRARFGDVTRIEAECRAIDRATQRERARAERFGDVWRDTRYALRGMITRPLVATIIVVTLALGIGANTAIFSVVNAVLLHPLPTPGLDQLVVIQDDLPGLTLRNTDVSPGEALDLFKRTDLFQSATAFGLSNLTLTGANEPQRVKAASTIGAFFSVFGTRPYLGRLYRPADSENGNTHVVVLSYAFWQQIAGGDPHIVGSTLRLSDQSYEVIGVLPPDFQYPRTVQLWKPMAMTPGMVAVGARGDLYLTAVARRQPTVTMNQLHDKLTAEADRWHEKYGSEAYDPKYRHTLVAQPFVTYLAGQLRPILLILAGAVGFVLLIACANVASLQLVRGATRSKELAIRTALGGGRWALVRQLLIENAVLAVAGGIVGLGVGGLIVRVIARSDAGQFAMLRDARLDPSVLAFTAAVTIVAALLFGVLPALRATRVNASDALKESAGRGMSAGPGRSRFLQGAVVVQVALALVLLLGSGLVIRNLAKLLDSDPGFRAENVLTLQLSVAGSRYPNTASRVAFFNTLFERLRAIRGVQSVGTAWGLPFTDGGTSSPFRVVGRPPVTGDVKPHADMWYVGGDYFRAMGIQLIEGRTFNATDVDGAQRVSIIDETLAKQFFPNEDPIGKQIVQGMETTIVGVVRSVKKSDLGAPDKATVYYPYPQVAWISTMSLAVRSTLPPSTVTNVVRSTVRELDATMPVFDIMPMRERVDHSLGARRLAMSVLAGFAALSLVLAVLGLYGVLSYGVSQRRHEIGIRMALGAETGDVERLVVRNGLLLVALGLAIGIAAFLGLGRVMAALLYGVGTHDPLTLVAGIVLLGLTALVACWVPARRAARVDPVNALRVE